MVVAVEDLIKYNFEIDLRKSKNAKKGLIDLCNKATSILPLKENSKIIEIGSFSGISMFIFSHFFKKIACVDSWKSFYDENDLASNPDLYDMKKVEKQFDEIKHFLEKENNILIEKYKLSSVQAADLFENNVFDMVYLDATHTYEAVKQDYNIWKNKLKVGGIFAFHDYNSRHFPGVTEAINEFFNKNTIYTFVDSSCFVIKEEKNE